MDPNQPAAQPANPAPQPTSTNGVAIAGFVLAFLFPFVGFILSIVGLVKAKDHGGNGKGLSIAGIVISIVITVLFTIPLVLVGFAAISHKAEEAKRRTQAASQQASDNVSSKSSGMTLGNIYTEKSGVYSIKLPKDWEATQTEASRDLSAIPPAASKDYVSEASVSIDKTFPEDTLASLVSTEVDSLKKDYGATIKSEADITIDGVAAHEIIAHEDTGAKVDENYTVILIKNDQIYYLTYITSPERIATYLPVFKASAQSFVVK